MPARMFPEAMGNRALIIGASGQDGSYLSEQLAGAGTQVFSLTRQGLQRPGSNVEGLRLNDRASIRRLIGDAKFDEIYYLAAFHHSADESIGGVGDIVQRSFETHVDGLLNVLDAMVACQSPAGLFYAASSHVFGVVTTSPQTEKTPLMPVCAYGVSKVAGVHLCRLYRQEYNIRACVGFLYNHESPRRPLRFLSRKVARAVVDIERGSGKKLVLGDLSTLVDWGYSPEYTEVMQRILHLDRPDDFIIASGRQVAVMKFVESAFAYAGLDWREHVSINPARVKKIDRGPLVGDSQKISDATGWSAKATVEELARLMVDAERTAKPE